MKNTIIIGAGIFGLLTAILAKGRGEDPIILEKHATNNKFNNYRCDHNLIAVFEKIKTILVANDQDTVGIDALLERIKLQIKKPNESGVSYNTIAADELVESLEKIAKVLDIKILRPSKVQSVSIDSKQVVYRDSHGETQQVRYDRLIFADGAHTSATELLSSKFQRIMFTEPEVKYNFSATFHINQELLHKLFPDIQNPSEHLSKQQKASDIMLNIGSGGEGLNIPTFMILVNGDTITIQGHVTESFAKSIASESLCKDWALQRLKTTLRVGEDKKSLAAELEKKQKGIEDLFLPYRPGNGSTIAIFPFQSSYIQISPIENVFIGGDAAKPTHYFEGEGVRNACADALALDAALVHDKPEEYLTYLKDRSTASSWVMSQRYYIMNLLRKLVTVEADGKRGIIAEAADKLQLIADSSENLPPTLADKLMKVNNEVQNIVELLTYILNEKKITYQDVMFDFTKPADKENYSNIMELLENVVPKIEELLSELQSKSFNLRFREQFSKTHELIKVMSILNDTFGTGMLHTFRDPQIGAAVLFESKPIPNANKQAESSHKKAGNLKTPIRKPPPPKPPTSNRKT